MKTRMPLIGATVIVLGTAPVLGASTDIDGGYEVSNVPIGQNIVVQYIGYEPKTIKQIDVGSGKEVVLNVELIESTTELNEVVVNADKDPTRPNNEMAVVSTDHSP